MGAQNKSQKEYVERMADLHAHHAERLKALRDSTEAHKRYNDEHELKLALERGRGKR